MTMRAELSGTQRITFTQQFNVENAKAPLRCRLVVVTNTVSGQVTQFTYDGDGARVKKMQSGVTTAFVGNAYEWTSTSTTKYYYLGGKRVALRTAAGVTYLHGDHLGSASLTTGAVSAAARYYPYGGDRWTSGSMPTDFRFTGQRQESGFGLYDYNARYYDPLIGRFVSPDTIIPSYNNPQSLNRYSYVYNNPIKYSDPTGHCPCALAIVFLNPYVWIAAGATALTTYTVYQNRERIATAAQEIASNVEWAWHQRQPWGQGKAPDSQTKQPKVSPKPPPPPSKPLSLPQSKNNLLPDGGDSLTPKGDGGWTIKKLIILGASGSTATALVLCSLDPMTCNLPNPEELVPAIEPKENPTPTETPSTSCGADYCLGPAPTPDPSIPIPVPAPTPFQP
jgi:RHS repeat-associated protein